MLFSKTYIHSIQLVSPLQTINVREYRRGNQKWTIQKNWQHNYGTQDEEKQNKNTTQYVLDTTIRK